MDIWIDKVLERLKVLEISNNMIGMAPMKATFQMLQVVVTGAVTLGWLQFQARVEAGSCAAIREGLVGWWSAEGNANDNLGDHDGIVRGATFVPGVRGQAFHFDGISSRVNVADGPDFELTHSLTIEGWLQIHTFLGAQIFFRGDTRPGLDPYFLSAEPGERVCFMIMTEENTYDRVYAPVAVDQWQHVAAVLDGDAGTMKLYVNGVLAAQTNADVRPFAKLEATADPGIGIGNHGGTYHNFPFNGEIDEIALYCRALSETEIQSIYQARGMGKCALPTYDLAREFSLVSNPNGVWSYGASEILGGPFTLFDISYQSPADNGIMIEGWTLERGVEPRIYHNPTTQIAYGAGGAEVILPDTVTLLSGTEGVPHKLGITRFTVPAGHDGLYLLESKVKSCFDGPDSGDTDYHVLKNGAEVFGQFLPRNARSGYTNVIALLEGDTLDFVVGRGEDGSGVRSGLQISVWLTQQPGDACSLEKLIARVKSSILGVNRKRPLLATLKAAQVSVERRNLQAAAGQLHAFQNKVRAQVAPRHPAIALRWITCAETILTKMEAQ